MLNYVYSSVASAEISKSFPGLNFVWYYPMIIYLGVDYGLEFQNISFHIESNKQLSAVVAILDIQLRQTKIYILKRTTKEKSQTTLF
jgi:hypothetical protein